MRRLLALLLLLALAPAAGAQLPGAIDATIHLSPTTGPRIEAPPGLVTLDDAQPGERYEFGLTLTKEYTTFEVRADGFDIERPRQVVPSLVVPETEYPLFYEFPNDRIWEVDGPGRVFFTNGTADAVVLRLGIPGPRNVTLVIERDVTPPTFTLGDVTRITHYGFYQETRTDELAIGDVQVRRAGSDEWVVNPTTELHFLQRFPVQGLDADAEYEARAVFTDWAGNKVTSDTYTVRSAPMPETPDVEVDSLSPAPNATLAPGTVTIRARIVSPESPVPRDGVRLFFDKREVTPDIIFDGAHVTYMPTEVVGPGKHSVSVEVTNQEGGKGGARWTFEVEGPPAQTPGPGLLALLAVGVGLALARRR